LRTLDNDLLRKRDTSLLRALDGRLLGASLGTLWTQTVEFDAARGLRGLNRARAGVLKPSPRL